MTTPNHTTDIPYGYCHCGCGQKTNLASKTSGKIGWKKGEPLKFVLGHAARIQRRSLKERLWAKLSNTDDFKKCWEWQAYKNPAGYGTIGEGRRGNRLLLAHRAVYEIVYGKISDGMFVCHRCDNPACCNPDHLFLGTSNDNNQDMVQKGRQAKGKDSGIKRRGERNGMSKYSDDIIRHVRERYAAGNIKVAQLAQEMKLSKRVIQYILYGKRLV